MNDLAERVVSKWVELGIQRGEVEELDLTPDYLRRLEARTGGPLPDAFRALWL